MSRTGELIKRVLELDAAATPGPWVFDGQGGINGISLHIWEYMTSDVAALEPFPGSNVSLIIDYRHDAPLLARMLQRALGALGNAEIDALQGIPWCSEDYLNVFEEIEVMA